MFAIIASLFVGYSAPVDAPKEITPEWEERVLGISPGIKELPEAMEELVRGIEEPHFGKEWIEKIRAQVKKEKTGEYVEYWENGELKAKLPYKEGKPDSHLHGWYANGKDAFKGFFKDGVKQGAHITLYDAGEVSYPARVLVYNMEGKLDGKETTSHAPRGRLATLVKYRNGVLDGLLENYDNKGELKLSATYENGKFQRERNVKTFKPFDISYNPNRRTSKK